MHLCLFIYLFFFNIYITHVYIISYKKHEDVYIDIYMIYSLRCCDPCQITSQKFYTYVCTYVCASVCPALKSPPPLSIFLYLTHHSITSLPSRLLSLFSLNHRRTDRSYDRLHLRITYLFLSHVSVRVELAWMCDSMFEPRAFSIKEGIIIDS